MINKHIINGERIFVHCYKGISRAPSFVMGYCILYKKMSLEQSFELVRMKSPIVDPNAGFLIQLGLLNNGPNLN